MKINIIKQVESIRSWAFGSIIYAFGATLIMFIGSAWSFSFSFGPGKHGSKYAFGLCFGPFTLGGAA